MFASRSYRDLAVWQKSILLAKEIYGFSSFFPKEEIYGMISQIRRASVSIPVNIAEGQARNSVGEFRQFLGIAKGSAAELETLIILSNNLGYLNDQNAGSLLTCAEEIHKMIHGLLKSLKKNSA